MNNIKISVILPVYNVEKYLNKCIDSILNQTYTNYELIIIDDGSTDNSGNICDEYKVKDNRIQVIHQENLGLSAARNKGIDLAKGKYITFIDSDDYIDSKYLEILYNIIENNNADISACDFTKVYKNIKQKNLINYEYNEKNITREEAYKNMILEKNIYFYSWGKLYKTSILKNNKFTTNKIYEDLYIINSLIENSNKIVITDYVGYYYLQRKNSITNNNMDKKNFDLIDATNKFTDFMNRKYPNLKEYITKRIILSKFIIYRKAILDKNFKKEYCSIRKEILKYKKEIFKSTLYSKKEKIQTFLLLFGNGIYKLFYKIYKKGC